jgi:hypothetical protein
MVPTIPTSAAPACSVSTRAVPTPAPAGADVAPWSDIARPRRHRPGSSRDSYIEVQYTSREVLGTLRQLRKADTLTERQKDVGTWLVENVLTWSRLWDAVDLSALADEYKVSSRTLRRDLAVLEALGVLRRWHPPGRGYLPIIAFPVSEAGRLAAATARKSASTATPPVTARAAKPTAGSAAGVPRTRASLPPRDSAEFRAAAGLFAGICDVMGLPMDVVSDSVRRLFIGLAGNGWTPLDLKELLLRDGWPKVPTGDGIGLMKYRLETYAAGQRPPRLEREEAEQARAQRQRHQRELTTQLLAEREEKHRREHYRPVQLHLDSLSDEEWNELVRPAARFLASPRRGDSKTDAVALHMLAERTGHPKWQAPRDWTDRDCDQEAGWMVVLSGLVTSGDDGRQLSPGVACGDE